MAVELDFTLKDAQVLMGLLKMAREQENVTKAVKGTKEEYKNTEKEIERTTAAAKALIATPIERMTQKEKELNAAFKAGKLTLDEKTRAMEAYKQKIIGAERESQKLATANEVTFGSPALETLKGYAAGVIGITAVVGKLQEGIEKVNQLKLAGMEGLKSDYEHLVTLNQLSTSPEQFASRVKDFNELRSKYGLSTADAATLQETAISGENEASMRRFAATPGAGPAGERMRYATKLEKLAGGEITEEQADAMIKAAADPSIVTPAEMAKYTPSAGAMMQSQGATSAEVLGSMSALTDLLKGPEAAADRINNLMVRMSLDERFKGKGLIGGVEALQALPEAEREDFMKQAEGLNIAYEKITLNRALVDERIKAVREAQFKVGTPQDPILASQEQFESSVEAQAIVQNKIAEQQEQEALKGAHGIPTMNLETGRRRLRARLADQPQVAVAADQGVVAAERYGGTALSVATAGLIGDREVLNALLKIVGLQSEQVAATKAVEQNTKQRPRAPDPRQNPR